MQDDVRVRTEIGDTRHLSRGSQMQRRRYCASRTGKTVALVRRASLLVAALMAAQILSSAHAAESPGHVAVKQDSLLSARLQSLLDSLVATEPGVRSGLLLVDGPMFHWKGASGVAFADSQVAALPDDQFNIDSIAKMMTATIAMKLVEQKKVKLDDRIAEYLPDSLVEGLHVYEARAFGREITVRQLLNHTSGIVDDWACPGFLDLVAGDPHRRWSPEETIEYVKRNCPPRFRPGDGWHYSDTGYNLLGLVLERVAGKPLHELYREMLLDPLGMDHTYRPAYEPPRPAIPGRPPAERYLGDMECGLWTSVMTADWGGGGLVSTTEDLNMFLRSFVRGNVFTDRRTRDKMLAWVESGPHNNYGLGVSRVLFSKFDDPSVRALGDVWGHTGSSHNFMYYWPQEDLTIIGTLNQMAVETDLYETVASIMMTIRPAGQSGKGVGAESEGKRMSRNLCNERYVRASWDEQKLNEIKQYLEKIGTTAFLLTIEGKVVLSHGDVTIPYDVHSIRKAILSAIVGQHIGIGPNKINLESNLKELNINDSPNPLSEFQQKAKVIHLIKSISGINHAATGEFEGWQSDKDKILGTEPNEPGTVWAYNNWDYNALTTIFERVTGLTVYEAFKTGIADPLDMQDFSEESIYFASDSSLSMHKKAGFFMSARDMSKLGQLYVNKGKWKGKQLIPSTWIERITSDYVKTNESGMNNGHGYLWWVPDDSTCQNLGIPTGCYFASGFGRQRIFIIPEWNVVIIHQVNTEYYDECFTKWARDNQLEINTLEEATMEIFSNFLIHLIKCNKIGYSEENKLYKKCCFVSGSQFEKLLQMIAYARK